MKSTILKICSVVIILMISMTATGQCADFRFPVGLAYASGVTKIVDKMKENYFLETNIPGRQAWLLILIWNLGMD